MVKSQIPAESAPTFLLASRERGQGERFPFRQNRQLTQPRIVISGKNGNRFTMCGNLGNRLDGMSEFVRGAPRAPAPANLAHRSRYHRRFALPYDSPLPRGEESGVRSEERRVGKEC